MRSRDRLRKFKAFEDFSKDSKAIFKALSDSDTNAKHLSDYYSLCICPGGRNGGLSNTIVEVFFGNRPIDEVTNFSPNTGLISKFVVAHGATLGYLRTDTGHVICHLYPAASENQRPVEDAILLDYLTDPAKLHRRAGSHWKMLTAYMEATCVDGYPSWPQRVRVFYLRNFKQYIVDSKLQSRKIGVLARSVAQWSLTVGLSGVLIVLASQLLSGNQEDQGLARHQELIKASKESTSEIEKASAQLGQIKAELVELSKLTSESSRNLAEINRKTTRPQPSKPIVQDRKNKPK